MIEITGVHHTGCSKRLDFSHAQPWCAKTHRSAGKAAANEEARRTRRYVEPLSDARTLLADFFSILLLGLMGTVKADNKLDRTMVRFTPSAGAGDLSFPVCRFVVKSAKCLSALGDGRPGFVGSRDIGYEAACGERDVTALRALSLRHTETTRLFCRGV
jgi:hypothetical protein